MALAERSVERATSRGSGTYRIGARKRRRHARLLIDLAVDVVTATERRRARVSELGLASLVLQAGPSLDYGDVVEIVLPGEIKVSGTVRWNAFPGSGIQLAALGAVETHALVALLERA